MIILSVDYVTATHLKKPIPGYQNLIDIGCNRGIAIEKLMHTETPPTKQLCLFTVSTEQ